MISPALIQSKHQPHPIPVSQLRLLIVSDSSERLIRLRALLAVGEIEITSATSPEELSCACRSGHDLVVIDVSPERLGGVLKTLRKFAGCTEVPVLVEASRILTDPRLAGLLPKYRAMPCGHAELVALTRRRVAPHTEVQRRRRML